MTCKILEYLGNFFILLNKNFSVIFVAIVSLALIILAGGFYFLSFKNKGLDNAKNYFYNNHPSDKDFSDNVQAGGSAKILFLGDLMFDRWIRQVSEKKGGDFVFEKVDALLKSEDLVVGNLEGPITENPSVSVNTLMGEKNNYIFTFPPETAENIYNENIRLVSLGNNHILNFGEDGLQKTKSYLTAAGVDFFGDTGKNSERFFIKEIKGARIAFVNYNQFSGAGSRNVLDDLREVKKMQPDFAVVYAHWGTEFVAEPSEKIKESAHQFIDEGADLVIGSHPHVMQIKEIYKGKTIYYSLGNFIFDQYFDSNTQNGMVVQAEFDAENKKINFKEYFVRMEKNGQTSVK